MTVNRRFFDNLIAERGLSLRQLATRMGMSHSQLSLTFSGMRRMQLEEACKLASILGVTLQKVAVEAGIEGARQAGRRATVIGALRGNGEVELYEGKGVVQRTNCPEGLPQNVEVIQARTADSPLSWLDGWLFYFDPETDGLTNSLGRLSYIELEDGRKVVAALRRGYQEGTYALSGPFNSESEKVASATPILMARS